MPLLKLTEKAWEKLKRKEKIMLPISGEALRDAVRDSQSSTKAEIHEDLLDELKILRVSLADDYQVPPYVIFGDNTLQEMATVLPQSTPSLLRITGVGEVKAEKYGARFLSLICRYAEKHQLPEKRHSLKAKNSGASAGKGASAKGASSGTVLATLQEYKKSHNLYKTASARNLSLKTVESHLVTAVQEGLLEESEFLSKDDVLTIRLQARRENSRRLTPLKEHFQERFSYFQLKIALANEQ
ncbi:ATP-dependent DNA helicase RecQ [Nitritalea halalkaliphila LW7]|uniref:ATP-dependent DNA helicase RecQ n=1 Tax=Nitritalea halalkaliphila LW7 TaxID=1189621 RepID=I5BZY4_9BACT|nr:HRDC domain-containing protein [Nitritalea halalkaliphila]EIM75136.1 ATP-dependent DNA helicase RecQ [Nitritalea halalkaliphila LW7]